MNAFERMLREKFGFKWDFELLMVKDLEDILGPADEEKAQALIKALMDAKNRLLMRAVIDEGETVALTYCKSLGWAVVKDLLLKAARIIKK